MTVPRRFGLPAGIDRRGRLDRPGFRRHNFQGGCERLRSRPRYFLMKRLLNVGGGTKDIPLPPQYNGWEHSLLDIDPRGGPDIVCDAREMSRLPSGEFDVVYCAHNLEHYYRHDAAKVLLGFHRVLKDDGFAHIRVPDIGEVMRVVVKGGMDIDDVLYESQAGPITARDVIYGFGAEIERSGNDYYAHRTGYTRKSLAAILNRCGFSRVLFGSGYLEIVALAFKGEPNPLAEELLRQP
jgi:SAM-dependent methyltransferase